MKERYTNSQKSKVWLPLCLSLFVFNDPLSCFLLWTSVRVMTPPSGPVSLLSEECSEKSLLLLRADNNPISTSQGRKSVKMTKELSGLFSHMLQHKHSSALTCAYSSLLMLKMSFVLVGTYNIKVIHPRLKSRFNLNPCDICILLLSKLAAWFLQIFKGGKRNIFQQGVHIILHYPCKALFKNLFLMQLWINVWNKFSS